MALARIAKEYADLQRNPLETCSAGPTEDGNLQRWIGYVSGPPDTPYALERFSVEITFPQDYPRKPFRLIFTRPVSHPDVSEEGEVRLAELEEEHWSPVFTVRTILICLQVLLLNPDYSRENSDEAAKLSSKDHHPKHGVGSNAGAKQMEPTHRGRTIGDKKYLMDMSRPEFMEYMNLPEAEQDAFFIKYTALLAEAQFSSAISLDGIGSRGFGRMLDSQTGAFQYRENDQLDRTNHAKSGLNLLP